MFFNKKMLICALTLITVTGCVTTNNTKQQERITNLEGSLIASQTLEKQTKSKLDIANSALKVSEDKITALNVALEKSQRKAKKPQPAKRPTTQKKRTHIDDKTILGESEWVYVSSIKENFKGRIDTGAATSSLNAVDIERFERDGKKWVRFNLTHDKGDKAEVIEAKIVRIAKIVQSSKSGKAFERPVIKLHVRIGDISQLTEFTLTDRLHMRYPVLIGRTFIQDVILVDVSKEYIYPKYQASKNKK